MKNSRLKALMLQKSQQLAQHSSDQDDFRVINDENLSHLQGGLRPATVGPCAETEVLEAGTCTGNTCGIYTSCSDCNQNGCQNYK
ncbi:hypothetical protein KTO58_18385 [Chitinophaga pendula]|uniref:hypothetical protein n=1 Tax=Chitinophaga TaxID=79328 RepID=UPI000BAEDA33|nr:MULTISPECIES: hypothetical protein [Chitinophaga]ASZ11354.1 hypothetical protein CK934_10430 [Chitinophaga sp. MD30]UCJ05644.1 hypothetical protein KTO58_18385 [Chitinophaga pendula]